jgi:hypothetical protein
MILRADMSKPLNTAPRYPGAPERCRLQNEPDNVDRVWLLSIRHSGTHYMYKFLELCGYQLCAPIWEKMRQGNTTGRKQFIHAHIEIGREYTKYWTDEKCVIPMRNPVEVFKTHCYRYKWSANEYEPYVLQAYRWFDEILVNRSPFVFYVDAPDQRGEFRTLAHYLGKPDANFIGQPNNVGTSRGKRDVKVSNGFSVAQEHMHENIPDSIFELAKKYGY